MNASPHLTRAADPIGVRRKILNKKISKAAAIKYTDSLVKELVKIPVALKKLHPELSLLESHDFIFMDLTNFAKMYPQTSLEHYRLDLANRFAKPIFENAVHAAVSNMEPSHEERLIEEFSFLDGLSSVGNGFKSAFWETERSNGEPGSCGHGAFLKGLVGCKDSESNPLLDGIGRIPPALGVIGRTAASIPSVSYNALSTAQNTIICNSAGLAAALSAALPVARSAKACSDVVGVGDSIIAAWIGLNVNPAAGVAYEAYSTIKGIYDCVQFFGKVQNATRIGYGWKQTLGNFQANNCGHPYLMGSQWLYPPANQSARHCATVNVGGAGYDYTGDAVDTARGMGMGSMPYPEESSYNNDATRTHKQNEWRTLAADRAEFARRAEINDNAYALPSAGLANNLKWNLKSPPDVCSMTYTGSDPFLR